MVDSRVAVDLGRVGVWALARNLSGGLAAELEALGFGAIWIGGSPPGDLRLARELLDATSGIAVATGIVNIWTDDAPTVAAAYQRVVADHPGRFLLGIGVGHREAVAGYQQPYAALTGYLDRLDEHGVPVTGRVLAALGPRVLRLAGERAAGAHPYLTTPAHTRMARELLGSGPLLAVEQKLVVDTDSERARAIARPAVGRYLPLDNYRRNLQRLGYTERDLSGEGSDRLVDALAPHGRASAALRAATAHLDAGADHVCVQVLGGDPQSGYRALASSLAV